ncbi:hypothetical protein HYV49_05505 [Candidatus Pacearchaeota archaeon]|nr:hypothetical protein [Candidatus Pacearchaeota archaeon]
MERGVSDKNILDKFAEDFCSIVDKYVKYIVVSGFVAISHGRKRTTEDIDMIIERISFEKFRDLHEELDKAGFECMQSSDPKVIYNDYLKDNISVRYSRKGGDFLPPEMEIKFVKDELDELQMKTRKKLPFTGLDIWFSSIEFNVAFKEELLKSDKDLEDARHFRIIYKDKIDNNFIEEIKRKIRKLRLNER